MRLAEIFHSIQGEGKLAGVPSVFVRASGCNLRCSWCDTPYASWNPEGQDVPVAEIIRRLGDMQARHAVLTGGEPAIMPDLVPLCDALKSAGYHITLETAATVFTPAAIDLASLSPKLSNSTPAGAMAAAHERQRLNPPVIQRFIDASPDFQLKFVVRAPADMDEIHALLASLADWQPSDVLLMPEGTDPAALSQRSAWIADVCKQTNFRFCQRLHIALFGNRRGT